MSIAVAAFVIAMNEHDAATALPLFDRALELSNSNVFALACSARALAFMRQPERAIERAELAIRLSPFDVLSYRVYLGAGGRSFLWVFRESSGRSEGIIAREVLVDSGVSTLGDRPELVTVRHGWKSEASAPPD
jgi:hypothetical protein